MKVTPPDVKKVEHLSTLLQSLDANITKKEAQKLSHDIFDETAVLTKQFRLVSPPQFHNFLVTVGLRDKGLCYDWSDALYRHLSTQKYKKFAFHLMGAHIGEYWREHNALVVIAKGMKVEDGIIVDPWRHSGRLYFSKVKEDTKYHWIHRLNRGCH